MHERAHASTPFPNARAAPLLNSSHPQEFAIRLRKVRQERERAYRDKMKALRKQLLNGLPPSAEKILRDLPSER